MKTSRTSGTSSPPVKASALQPGVGHGSRQSPNTEAPARGSKRLRSPESDVLEPAPSAGGAKKASADPKSASRLTDGLQRPQQPNFAGSPVSPPQSSGSGTPPLESPLDSGSRGLCPSDALSEEVETAKRGIIEYHNHLNGVLSPKTFLHILFGTGEGEQEVTWDSRLENAYWNTTKVLSFSTLEKLKALGFATAPVEAAARAADTEVGTAAPEHRHIEAMLGLIRHISEPNLQQTGSRLKILPIHRRDLTDRLNLLGKLGTTLRLQPKDRKQLLSHCLAARLANGTLPFVHFDWAYTVRSALWKAAFKASKGAATSHVTADLGNLAVDITTQSNVKTRLGGHLVSGSEIRAILKAFADRSASLGSLTLTVDADVKESLENSKPTLKPLAMHLRELQNIKHFPRINIEFTVRARKIFFFDEVFRVLREDGNTLDAVQLQGKVAPDEVSPALVKQLAANHCLNVAFLNTITHDNLSHSLPENLTETKARTAAKRAFSMVHVPDPVGLPVVGIDVAGPEVDEFSPAALAALVAEAADRAKAIKVESTVLNLKQADRARRGPTVLRIHAGEAYAVDKQDINGKEKRKQVGRTNCSRILQALSENEEAKELMSAQPEQLQVRIGHATFMDTRELRKAAELGVVLEFNPHSNAATGVDPGMEMKSFLRVLMFNSLEKVYRPTKPTRVRFCLSSDGQGVMDTTFLENVKTAAKKVNDRLLEPLSLGTLKRSPTAFSPTTDQRFNAVATSGDKDMQGYLTALTTLLKGYTEEELAHAHRHSIITSSATPASPEQDEATSPTSK
jgi:hypothetical protein